MKNNENQEECDQRYSKIKPESIKLYELRKNLAQLSYNESSQDSHDSMNSNKEKIDDSDNKIIPIENCRVVVERLNFNMLLKGIILFLFLNDFNLRCIFKLFFFQDYSHLKIKIPVAELLSGKKFNMEKYLSSNEYNSND